MSSNKSSDRLRAVRADEAPAGSPRTITEFQRAAHALARAKGFYDNAPKCQACKNSGEDHEAPFNDKWIGSRLALIHCEVSEAVECVVRGREGLGYITPAGTFETVGPAFFDGSTKPDGLPIELADVFLMLCDLSQSLGAQLTSIGADIPAEALQSTRLEQVTPHGRVDQLAQLHVIISAVFLVDSREQEFAAGLNDILHALELIALAYGIDLPRMAEIKHRYNETRPLMHGGKVL